MKTKLRLLPHWCQITGYTYLIGFMVSAVYVLIYTTGILPENNPIIRLINAFYRFLLGHWNIIGPINFVMIFMAIFSKERIEDEMTISIRINALIYLVCFLFLIHMLLYLPNGNCFADMIRELQNFMMEDFGVLTLSYAFLYKVMILINNWRLRNEE